MKNRESRTTETSVIDKLCGQAGSSKTCNLDLIMVKFHEGKLNTKNDAYDD